MDVIGGQVNSATTDNGQSLLPEEMQIRRIDFAQMNREDKTVIFDILLELPDEQINGLENISGVLECVTSSGSEKLDLGLIDFSAGAEGMVEDISVDSVESDSGKSVMKLSVNLPRGLKSVSLS